MKLSAEILQEIKQTHATIYSGNKPSGSRYHLFSHKQQMASHTLQVTDFALSPSTINLMKKDRIQARNLAASHICAHSHSGRYFSFALVSP